MAETQRRLHTCPLCWAGKHQCLQDQTTGACRRCRTHIATMANGAPVAERDVSSYAAAAHIELFKRVELSSLPSLDINSSSQDFNIFNIQITPSFGHSSNLYTFNLDDRFSTQNESLKGMLDSMVQACLTVPLSAKNESCQAVRKAALAGGYAHLLCSTVKWTEQVETIRDGFDVHNDFVKCNLHIHFQSLVSCRLSELIEELLVTIRFEDPGGEFPAYTSGAFASAAILLNEMGYFRRSLRNGVLCQFGHIPATFKDILISWFSSVEQELAHILRLDCGQHVDWHDTITGSKKGARRQAQTLSLAFTLRQIKQTIIESPPPPSFYTIAGSENSYLLSSPGTPTMLAVPGLSFYDSPGEIEQIPSHVSGPLSNPFDTWEETSVPGISDLFPDLRHYHTFSIGLDEGTDLIV